VRRTTTGITTGITARWNIGHAAADNGAAVIACCDRDRFNPLTGSRVDPTSTTRGAEFAHALIETAVCDNTALHAIGDVVARIEGADFVEVGYVLTAARAPGGPSVFGNLRLIGLVCAVSIIYVGCFARGVINVECSIFRDSQFASLGCSGAILDDVVRIGINALSQDGAIGHLNLYSAVIRLRNCLDVASRVFVRFSAVRRDSCRAVVRTLDLDCSVVGNGARYAIASFPLNVAVIVDCRCRVYLLIWFKRTRPCAVTVSNKNVRPALDHRDRTELISFESSNIARGIGYRSYLTGSVFLEARTDVSVTIVVRFGLGSVDVNFSEGAVGSRVHITGHVRLPDVVVSIVLFVQPSAVFLFGQCGNVITFGISRGARYFGQLVIRIAFVISCRLVLVFEFGLAVGAGGA